MINATITVNILFHLCLMVFPQQRAAIYTTFRCSNSTSYSHETGYTVQKFIRKDDGKKNLKMAWCHGVYQFSREMLTKKRQMSMLYITTWTWCLSIYFCLRLSNHIKLPTVTTAHKHMMWHGPYQALSIQSTTHRSDNITVGKSTVFHSDSNNMKIGCYHYKGQASKYFSHIWK